MKEWEARQAHFNATDLAFQACGNKPREHKKYNHKDFNRVFNSLGHDRGEFEQCKCRLQVTERP